MCRIRKTLGLKILETKPNLLLEKQRRQLFLFSKHKTNNRFKKNNYLETFSLFFKLTFKKKIKLGNYFLDFFTRAEWFLEQRKERKYFSCLENLIAEFPLKRAREQKSYFLSCLLGIYTNQKASRKLPSNFQSLPSQ